MLRVRLGVVLLLALLFSGVVDGRFGADARAGQAGTLGQHAFALRAGGLLPHESSLRHDAAREREFYARQRSAADGPPLGEEPSSEKKGEAGRTPFAQAAPGGLTFQLHRRQHRGAADPEVALSAAFAFACASRPPPLGC